MTLPPVDEPERIGTAYPSPASAAELQRWFEALAESAPVMLWVAEPGGAFSFASRGWQEFTGEPPEAALRRGWTQLVHAEDRRHVEAALLAADQTREPFAVDCRLRHASGLHRWVMAAGRPRFAPDGDFLGLVGAVVDVDDRKRAEAALRRTQQAARFLAAAGAALAEASDTDTILRKVASLAVPFLADWCVVDVAQEDGSLERLAVVHSEPRKAPLVHELARRWLPDRADGSGPGRVLAHGQPEMMEDVPDAAVVPWSRDQEHSRVLRELGIASYLCVPVRSRQKTRAAITFVAAHPDRRYESGDLRLAEDLALRAAAAVENAELYRVAVEADRRKDEFLAVLSHELRTPLNAIVGWAHILRESAATPEITRKAVEAIHRNAHIQTQLIADILDISRIVAGKLRLDVRPMELAAVVDAAVDTLRPAATAKCVSLEAVLDPGAGPISGDASRLQQVVWNLLSNAIRFVGEKVGRVEVRLEAVGSHVRLTVEDNGPGIDPELLPYIFERFRQADSSATRPHQGLGLGLAIVRHLVELHGGTVRAENRDGPPGAVFTVDLPRRSVAAAAGSPHDAERHPLEEEPLWLDSAPSLAGLSVLAVDDHEDARDLLRTVLERCGAAVRVAASAREALHAVSIEPPDVVLTDIEMPGEDGYDLVRALRALPPDRGGLTPVVALTAYATAHDRVRVLRAGFQMQIPKPVQPAELAEVVANLARRGRAR